MSSDVAAMAGRTTPEGTPDRSEVRSLRRAAGMPAPFRPTVQPAMQPTEQAAPPAAAVPTRAMSDDSEPVASMSVVAEPVASEPVATSALPVSEQAGEELQSAAAFLRLLQDPREVTRLYRDAHEEAGFKADTFVIPVELYQTLTRVAKQRRVAKKWLVAAALDALLQGWDETVGPQD